MQPLLELKIARIQRLSTAMLVSTMLFLAAGMNWIAFPGLGSVKVTQVAILVLILFAILCARTRRTLIKLTSRYPFLVVATALWGAFFLISSLFVPFSYSLQSVVVTLVYMAFAFALAAVFLKIDRPSEDFVYRMGTFTIIGVVLMLFILIGFSPIRFFQVVLKGVQSGQPSQIIFALFGNSGAIRLDEGEGIIGLRHNIAVIVAVALLMMLHARRDFPMRCLGDPVFLFGLFFVFALQSRSSWACLLVPIVIRLACTPTVQRASMRGTLAGVLVLPFLVYIASVVMPVLLRRLGETQSTEARAEDASIALSDIVNAGLFPGISRTPANPHNIILESGVGGGFVGLILAAAMVYAVLVLFLRLCRSPDTAFAAGAVSAFLVRAFTSGSNLPEIGGCMGVGFGIYVLERRRRERALPATALVRQKDPRTASVGAPDMAALRPKE